LFVYYRNKYFLLKIKEWRRKWQVGSQWYDADIEELYQDLHDIHPHVRFTAIVICSRAAQYLTQKEIGIL